MASVAAHFQIKINFIVIAAAGYATCSNEQAVGGCQSNDMQHSELGPGTYQWIQNCANFTKPRASLAYTRNVKDNARRVLREHRDVVTANSIRQSAKHEVS